MGRLIKFLILFIILAVALIPASAQEASKQVIKLTDKGSIDVGLSTVPANPAPGQKTALKIAFINKDSQSIQQHIDYRVEIMQGDAQVFGVPITHTTDGSVSIPYEFKDTGKYQVNVYVEGILFQIIPPEKAGFDVTVGQTQISVGDLQIKNPPGTKIPDWIKNNAKWWAAGQIQDSDFVQGIQYLIVHSIMKIPKTESASGSSQQIPTWVKNNAGWWADGKIQDSDFVSGIQYLITNGIMKI